MRVPRPTSAALIVVALVGACTSAADSGGSQAGEPPEEVGDSSRPATTTSPSARSSIPERTTASTVAPGPTATSAPLATPATVGTCWTSAPATGNGIAFVDTTAMAGMLEPLIGMYGHAVAAGDVNDDGWTDLFVAGFADRPIEQYQLRGASGPSPERLLLGGENGFVVDPTFPGELARTSGATMADLDADGDLDLVAVRNPRGRDPITLRSTVVYEQVDGGWTLGEPLLEDVAGRSVATIDVDRDGLLDLLVVADQFGGGSTRLLRNDGGLRFTEATSDWGMPDDLTGLALTTVDLDLDGWSDVVVSGEPRVLMGGPEGFTVESHGVLRVDAIGDEDDPAGIAVGDLDGDGRPDLVIGQHFNSTIDDGARVPVRILMNRATPNGMILDDVTEASGSPDLQTKSPHVGVVDLDNDGILDVVTSAISASGAPIVLSGLGARSNGTPTFEMVGRPGDGGYFVTGVEADLDRDGRIDVFQVAWEPGEPSRLFTNASASGHWIEVDVGALAGGPGDAAVEVLEARSGDVLGRSWGASTSGYAAGPSSVVHVGLGDDLAGDVTVRVTPAASSVDDIALTTGADRRISIGGC